MKKLYNSFKMYYEQETGKPLIIGYHWYFKAFRGNCNFTFRQPKTDVCDFLHKIYKET